MVFKATPMAVPSADPPLATERLPHTPLSSPHNSTGCCGRMLEQFPNGWSPKTGSVGGVCQDIGKRPQGRVDQLAVGDTGLGELSAAGVIAGSDVTG